MFAISQVITLCVVLPMLVSAANVCAGWVGGAGQFCRLLACNFWTVRAGKHIDCWQFMASAFRFPRANIFERRYGLVKHCIGLINLKRYHKMLLAFVDQAFVLPGWGGEGVI